MKSHALLRTNVGLTTNVKLMVGNTYSLYLDSIVSTPELGDVRYKKFQFSKNNYWDEVVPYFFKGTPTDIAFKIKYENDNDNMMTDFSKQYDDLYQYGARNIVDNKDYSEDYEFFAPLYIHKTQLPKQFVVFRIDGPGLVSLTKDNFNTEILGKLKCVQAFDMTRKSALGEWLDNNITKNKSFPITSFYMDYRKNEFSSWFGIDFEDGGYSEKAFMLDAILEYENTYHDFEKMVFDGFKNNKVVFPHIINFSFLFNDTPATPTTLRKWSINRYMGFYMDDLELVNYISPYQLPIVKDDVTIDSNNILSSPTGNPFLETFKKNDYPYIEIGGNFYKVSKYTTTTSGLTKTGSSSVSEEVVGTMEVVNYKIISNISLKGRESEINKNLISITSTDGLNKLTKYDGSTYVISNFDESDVWLIQIDGNYHNLIKKDGILYINTDYAFSQSVEKFDYYINDPDPNYRKSISLVVDDENPPKKFGIYRCKFSDIKDFDSDVIDTQFTKYEYAKKLEVTLTDETKMHTINHQSTTFPRDLNDYKVGGVVTNLPAASEYTANGETFRLVNNELSTLWRKNPERSKWGFKGSLSSNDYPYLLNNSFSAEDYNRTVNVHSVLPKRTDRNLDYFLTVNSSGVDYTHHSLHVEDIVNGQINTNFKFELDKYLGINYDNDYFSYFFGKKSSFDSGDVVTNTAKYAYFNIGDTSIPNSTLFKGIKFNLYNVESIKITDGDIETINLKNNNEFEGYKLSVLLSKNNYSINSSTTDLNTADVKDSDNILRWSIIDMWKSDKIYASGSVVNFYDILYQCNTHSQITDPTSDPSNSSDWQIFTHYLSSTYSTIFWNPITYNGSDNIISNNMYGQFGLNIPPLVYNSSEYYYSSGVSGNTFWNPQSVYGVGDVVLFNNKIYQSGTTSNTVVPLSTQNYNNDYWSLSDTSTTIWSVVNLWDINKEYSVSNSDWNTGLFDSGHYVVYENVVYMTTGNPSVGTVPTNDSRWKRIYSMSADTNYSYGPALTQNNIILHNNRYYWSYELATSTASIVNQTLENGIYVIINKKWKNVLINIYVNDNTYDRISNVNRDDLYYDLYSKLTAFNFINSINDLSNKYDFSDKIRYTIIEIDGSIKLYDFNNINSVSRLPYLLKCEGPDEFLSRIKSLDIKPVNLNASDIKINRRLQSGNIVTLDQLNFYSDINLATSVERRKDDAKLIPNYSGLQNATYNIMNRHSGPYDPIFHTIHLFKSPTSDKDYGNSKFDTDLTDFGMIKERTVSKVNRRKNILKLKNKTDLKSVYPMLDEYGYHTTRFFIFKSTWDFEYHIECVEAPIYSVEASNQSVVYPNIDNGTNTNNLSTL